MIHTTTKRLLTVLAMSGFVLAGPVILADIQPLNLDAGQARAANANSNGNGNSSGSGGGSSSAGGGGHSNGGGSTATASSNRGGGSAPSNTSATPNGKAGGFFDRLFRGFAANNQPAAEGHSHGTPKAAVRQYVVENGLSQGQVARELKSWNSINRNPQAFLNNLDNPTSLPGLQAAYILQNALAEGALTAFTDLGGVADSPPDADDLNNASLAQSAQAVLDAEAMLAGGLALDAAQITELEAVIADYSGDDPIVVVAEFEAAYNKFSPQDIIDQYNAWQIYTAAEEAALADFAAASVSYPGPYDDELEAVRERVDTIVGEQQLLEMLTVG